MINFKQHPPLRKLYVSLRDTWLLSRQFQWPLVGFMIAIFGGGLLYYGLVNRADESINSSSEAIYHILGLTFLQSFEGFPQTWYLQSLYFIMPIIGVGILAQRVADFGVLFFNRHERGPTEAVWGDARLSSQHLPANRTKRYPPNIRKFYINQRFSGENLEL